MAQRSTPRVENLYHLGAVLEANRRALEGVTDAAGRTLELVPFPYLPQQSAGSRTCRSYLNFYLAEGAVILPAYGHPLDDVAARRAETLFPDRTIVPVRVEHIAAGGGAIHCVTLQQPRLPDAT